MERDQRQTKPSSEEFGNPGQLVGVFACPEYNKFIPDSVMLKLLEQ